MRFERQTSAATASPWRGSRKEDRSVSMAEISMSASTAAHASSPSLWSSKAVYKWPRPFAF